MTRSEHRRSGGQEHHHRGGHRHSADAYPHTFIGTGIHGEGGGAYSGAIGGGVGAGAYGGDGHGHSLGGFDHGGAPGMDATFIWKLSKLGRIGSSRLRFDDDFADRLSYQYTGVLLFLFIGLIGIRQYVGKPIQCWIPQEFTRGWEEYAENYCWVSNTYFAPVQNRLPPVPDREMLLIGYYQWAPIVMAVQAMAFYLPCLIWRLFMAQSGFNVRRILQMACDSNVLLPEHTMKNVRFMARYIEGCIYRQRDYRRSRLTNLAGYSSANCTDVGQIHQYLYQYPAHHHHPKGYLHHHHHYHHQSPPYISPPHAPPTYTSAAGTGNFPGGAGGYGGLNSYSGGFSRGNGDATYTSGISRRGRRTTASSLLNRIRWHFSVESEKTKTKKQSSNDAEECPGAEDHPMLGRYKSEEATSFCSPLPPRSTAYHSNTTRSIGDRSSGGWGCCGKQHGNYLVVLYFFIKLLYLTNIICQLFMMEKFVGNSYNFYGLRVLIDLVRGREWFHSGNFPRVTFCDFEAKKLGKNHKYTLQCVLPLNMFLEKIYIFLWFWHCMVGLVTLSSFIIWFYRMGFPSRRVKFIRKYLKIMSVLRDTDKLASGKFVENYLRSDGVFLIRLISINVGDLLAGDLACELWHIYRHKRLHEIEEEKYPDAIAGLGDFVMPPVPGIVSDHGTAVPTELTPGTTGIRVDKNHTASRPIRTSPATSTNNLINNTSTNNDDSIV